MSGPVVIDTSSNLSQSGKPTLVGIIHATNSAGVVTGTITSTLASIPGASITSVPPTTTNVRTVLVTSTSATPSSTSPPAPAGPQLSTLLPAILAPVVFILILIPIIIFTYLHFRNKRRQRGSSPDIHGPPQETALLQHKISRSLTLPSPFSDSERIQEGGLGWFDERRGSMERRSNGDIVALYERRSAHPSDSYGFSADGSAGPRPPPPAAGPSRGLPPPSAAAKRAPPPRPTKPAKTPDASWPLPATTLPSPAPFNDASSKSSKSSNSSKPLPHPANNKKVPQLPQLPSLSSELFSMREELRPDSETYDLSTSAARNSAKAKRGTASTADPFSKRESDLVSELSDAEGDYPRRSRRDTDAVSVVSAMTGRSQSGRRKSSASVVSAMSPNEEPEMPKPFFGR